MNIGKTAAIVLAAGQGKRMQAGQPKQFMLLGGRPVLYYALAAFEKSEIDEIILVTVSYTHLTLPTTERV